MSARGDWGGGAEGGCIWQAEGLGESSIGSLQHCSGEGEGGEGGHAAEDWGVLRLGGLQVLARACVTVYGGGHGEGPEREG